VRVHEERSEAVNGDGFTYDGFRIKKECWELTKRKKRLCRILYTELPGAGETSSSEVNRILEGDNSILVFDGL
jgi:hypothetical protein